MGESNAPSACLQSKIATSAYTPFYLDLHGDDCISRPVLRSPTWNRTKINWLTASRFAIKLRGNV